MASQWIDFVAGWCSGAATVLCLQPLDTILTRRQAGSLLVDGSLWTSSPSKFWRGTVPMIGALPLQSGMLMAGYGLGKSSDSLWGVFIGGCTGGVIQSLLMSPVELVKVQQQVHLARGPIAVKRAPWSKGLGATLLRDGIPHGIWFVSYELCKDTLSENMGENHQDYTISLLSGAFAATAAWVSHMAYSNELIRASNCNLTFFLRALDIPQI